MSYVSYLFCGYSSSSFFITLQSTTLKTWSGKPENVAAAKDILVKLAAANSAAQVQRES